MPRLRKLDGRVALAQRLSEISALHFDLMRVELYCRRYEHEMSGPRPEPLVVASLCSAAIVCYGRTCNTGVRPAISSDVIDRLAATHRKTHDRVKALRDKWISHSVNDMEETRVVIEARGTHVLRVFEEHQALLAAAPRDMRALARLCRALNRHLGKWIREERVAVERKLREMPPTYIASLSAAGWSKLGRKPDRARSKW